MSIKLETRVNDLRRLLARKETLIARGSAMSNLTEQIYAVRQDVSVALQRAQFAASDYSDARAAFERLPPARRSAAEGMEKAARDLGSEAVNIAGLYSGDTAYGVVWGSSAEAHTSVGCGDRYSRGCGFSKNDATHRVILDPAGIPLLLDDPELISASDREGMPLIALYPDGTAVWVECKGKRLRACRGWVLRSGNICYHSTTSIGHAHAGLMRKLRAAERQSKKAAANVKDERRARLVARLCSSVNATLEDAKKLGFCAPGIEAFQHRHGIGDSASLPALVRTGNPLAIKLALSVARKVKHGAKA